MQKLLNNLERDIYHSSKNDQLMIVKNFLSEIDYSLVKLFINKAKEKDAFSLAFKVILSPPHIVPLATFHGFSVEIIHWLYSDDIEMRTDNEDIHDHFGIIMSKALIGNPYLNISYEVNNSGNLEKIGEFLFRENNIILINPNANYYKDFLEILFKDNANVSPNSRGRDWINYKLEKCSGNIIMFASGLGDGLYPRYVGFDKNGKAIKLIADFIQLTNEENPSP